MKQLEDEGGKSKEGKETESGLNDMEKKQKVDSMTYKMNDWNNIIVVHLEYVHIKYG